MTLDDIQSDFALLEDWEDRYRYVIELGRGLPAFPDSLRTDANKVRGCASQVWLATMLNVTASGQPGMAMRGTSDALIVQGLIAILFAIYDGKSLDEILATDAQAAFAKLGLKEHLTPQRSNGLAAMVERTRADALRLSGA
ncbi:MAG TPA: SufE family protein [Hyphomicrobium sp.]|nr:SufE family protein [Hyphomicrobium sp.]